MYSNRATQGIAECERALAIDRNLAAAHAWIGMAKFLAGRNEETEEHVLEALRISPRDIRASSWMLFVGIAKFVPGRDEEAVVVAEPVDRAESEIGHWPIFFSPPRWRASAVSKTRAKLRAPGSSSIRASPSRGFDPSTFSDNPVYLAGRERLYEGMRLAGVPER